QEIKKTFTDSAQTVYGRFRRVNSVRILHHLHVDNPHLSYTLNVVSTKVFNLLGPMLNYYQEMRCRKCGLKCGLTLSVRFVILESEHWSRHWQAFHIKTRSLLVIKVMNSNRMQK